jgi:hypothetical protein
MTRRGLPWPSGARLLLLAMLGIPSLRAGDPEFERLPPVPAATNVATNASVRQVAPGVFALGQVRLDKAQRTVSFPGVLNMNAGLVEYVVVTAFGKTHESLVRTDVSPFQIHLALLLLGAKGAGTNAFPEDHAKPLPGEPVRIELAWTVAGREKRVRAEDTLRHRATRAAVSRGSWTYNGSRVLEGMFVAQEMGSIVSLIEDPDALVNNPRPGREDDELWEIKPEGLPELETPVQVIFTLEDKPPAR